LKWYLDRPVVSITGILSFLLLILIAAISNKSAMYKLGGRKWKTLQRLVYPVLILTVIHYMAMGKGSPTGWLRWFRDTDSLLPGGTLLLTTYVLLILMIRFSFFIKEYVRLRFLSKQKNT
jgi:DMSO/TMAO reductase YedYZ heme-binding membrane subunit